MVGFIRGITECLMYCGVLSRMEGRLKELIEQAPNGGVHLVYHRMLIYCRVLSRMKGRLKELIEQALNCGVHQVYHRSLSTHIVIFKHMQPYHSSRCIAESRKVFNLPPAIIFHYQNLPLIFEVLVVDRAWLGRGSRYKLRKHILVSYSYGFELMVIVAETNLY